MNGSFRGQIWTPDGRLEDLTLELDGGRIAALRPPLPSDPEPLPGVILPGLINAHAHLELSAGGLVGAPQSGFLGWLGALFASDPITEERREAAGKAAARRVVESGTSFVMDVTNRGDTAEWFREAGLFGTVHHELLTFDKQGLPGQVAIARKGVQHGPVSTRPSPHALFSTAPDLVSACVEQKGPVATLHIGEAEHEAEFVAHGTGPMAAVLDRLGRDWRWWQPQGDSPIEHLNRIGALSAELLLVHGVLLSDEDLALVAAAQAPVCLCPRSNAHIGGVLPDVPKMLKMGLRLCIGTDSLASSPDLDVLGEVAALSRAFPEVAPERWLAMVTHEGADAVGAEGFGRLSPGLSPGVLWLPEVSDLQALCTQPPAQRRWLSPPEVL